MSKKELFMLIDLTPTEMYITKPHLTFDEYTDEYIKYVKENLETIEKTLSFCKENGIYTYRLNYINDRIDADSMPCDKRDNEVSRNFKFDYWWNNGCDGSQKPNFSEFSKIYYAGASFDECVTRTRNESYMNLNHDNKVLVLDCCIQEIENTRHHHPQRSNWQHGDDIRKYARDFCSQNKIKYVDSLIS